MTGSSRLLSIEDLPGHLIVEILSSGGLDAADLARFEASCRLFRVPSAFPPNGFRSVVEYAAFCLCKAIPSFAPLTENGLADHLFERCGMNWKKVLKNLQSMEQSCGLVETSAGKMQVTAGAYHTLLINSSSVYSCGTSVCGILGHGPQIVRCETFRPIDFPFASRVVNVSASQNHAAFVTQSGEVFTCGDNASFSCGHGEAGAYIFRPTRVEAMNNVPCKQVATGLDFTVLLTMLGQLYTFGSNTYGQLGHGDTLSKPTPTKVESLERLGYVVQVAAGEKYTFAVTEEGTVHSFGSCNFHCLGHGDPQNELLPRAIQSFRTRNIRIMHVSAGDKHAAAVDSDGYVHTWGTGFGGVLGHGDDNSISTPQLVESLKGHRAVQVCARHAKTFVLTDEGAVYAFGWMGFRSLGFSDLGFLEKVRQPRRINSLRPHFISQISTGIYHTVAVSKEGRVFCFGYNGQAQLGQAPGEGSIEPTEIVLPIAN